MQAGETRENREWGEGELLLLLSFAWDGTGSVRSGASPAQLLIEA